MARRLAVGDRRFFQGLGMMIIWKMVLMRLMMEVIRIMMLIINDDDDDDEDGNGPVPKSEHCRIRVGPTSVGYNPTYGHASGPLPSLPILPARPGPGP